MTKRLGWLVALGVLWVAVAWSQAAEPAGAGKPGAKRAEFDKWFVEWKRILAELRRLRDAYRKAQPAEAAQIETRYGELVAQGEALSPKLVAAAEAAFLESPGDGKDLGAFLRGIVVENCRADNYEEAWRLSKLLLDNGYEDKMLIGPAGWAAFCVGEFAAAQKYLADAKENNVLEKYGEGIAKLGALFLREIPFYRDAGKKEQEIRQAEAKADDLPRVLLKTSKGDIEVELFENEAPNTVANFISLVEKKFYNGAPFHRVIDQFMAQGGDPTGTGGGGPGYAVPCECYRPGYRVHFRGCLSMAHAGRDTGGSQFFLTFRPTHHLDGIHTCFGRVIKGMEVLAKLQRVNPENPEEGVQPDKIVEATVVRKRPHPYEPKKLPERKRMPIGRE